jgi:hypothetical protein
MKNRSPVNKALPCKAIQSMTRELSRAEWTVGWKRLAHALLFALKQKTEREYLSSKGGVRGGSQFIYCYLLNLLSHQQ